VMPLAQLSCSPRSSRVQRWAPLALKTCSMNNVINPHRHSCNHTHTHTHTFCTTPAVC
jgi:hypothetical protein